MPSAEDKNMNPYGQPKKPSELKDTRQPESENIEELSPAWRELLGIEESSGASAAPVESGKGGADEESPIPMVSGDPWIDLVRARGVEEVDLQRTRLREIQEDQRPGEADDSDVKHALDLMQEKPKSEEK